MHEITETVRLYFVFAKLLQAAGVALLIYALLNGLGLISSGAPNLGRAAVLMIVGGAMIFSGVVVERKRT